ncbi:MAG: TatD family nuclease-associated radical SAM protein [Elusimicrobiota bacterium]
MSITYKYHNNLYINLTNKCTSACIFCIKNKWKGQFRGHDLRLEKEPSAEEVINEIKDPKKYGEIIFCGYGEPFMRLDILKEVAAWVKEQGGIVRVNTSGHGNLIHGRNILPELKGIVDAVSISLNASDSEEYDRLHIPKFGPETFQAVLDFAKECVKHIPDVTITCIEFPGEDLDKCRKIAVEIGTKFRSRPYLDEVENR